MHKAVCFLTGSSGSGKTTLLKRMTEHLPPGVAHYHFDDNDEFSMADWFSKVLINKAVVSIFDGSKDPKSIQREAARKGIERLKIVLIDCDHEERRRRLVSERNQPELDKLDIYAWAAYLRGQADALELEVIETHLISLEESSQVLLESVKRFCAEVAFE